MYKLAKKPGGENVNADFLMLTAGLSHHQVHFGSSNNCLFTADKPRILALRQLYFALGANCSASCNATSVMLNAASSRLRKFHPSAVLSWHFQICVLLITDPLGLEIQFEV